MGKRKTRNQTGQRPIVVTLVHGTFARKAAWIKSDSALSRALSKDGCQVSRFTWSGWNSFHARARAAQELAEHLEQVARENRGARQWVVAHSHGGNVALHALERVRDSGRHVSPVSVVTLATPFIHARARAHTGYFIFQTVLFGTLLLVGAGTAVATGRNSWAALGIISFGSVFAIEVLLCIIGAVRYRKFLGRGCGKRLVDSIQAPTVSAHDLVAIRAAGDEASFSLASGQFVGWLGSLIARPLGQKILWGFIILTVQLSFILPVMLGRATEISFSLMTYLFGGVGLFCLGGVIVLLAGSLVFGLDDGPFVSVFASVSAEATPPGEAMLVQLKPFVAGEKRRLIHSRLYDDPQVIQRILKEIY